MDGLIDSSAEREGSRESEEDEVVAAPPVAAAAALAGGGGALGLPPFVGAPLQDDRHFGDPVEEVAEDGDQALALA
jgi:hypothetical protein